MKPSSRLLSVGPAAACCLPVATWFWSEAQVAGGQDLTQSATLASQQLLLAMALCAVLASLFFWASLSLRERFTHAILFAAVPAPIAISLWQCGAPAGVLWGMLAIAVLTAALSGLLPRVVAAFGEHRALAQTGLTLAGIALLWLNRPLWLSGLGL